MAYTSSAGHDSRRISVRQHRRNSARPSFRPLLAAPALIGVVAACVATSGLAQDSNVVRDSIAAIDRAAPRPRVWAVVDGLRRFHGSLEAHGVRPWVVAQGPNSGVGPELRLGPARPSLWLHARGVVTLREYWQVEGRAGARLPGWAAPLSLEATAALEDRPKDVFFGIGNASSGADRSDYALRRWTVGGRIVVHGPRRISLGLSVDWMQAETGAGGDDAFPDIDSTFGPSARPGFGVAQRYLSLGGGAEWSAGPRHTTARTGSWAAVGYRWRLSRTASTADGGLVSVSAGVELPFHQRRRSLALALYLESLRATSAGELPFHLLPAIGGPLSLPALLAERYRDRDAFLAKLEYRHRAWSDRRDALWADVVVFTNHGMVAGRLGDELAWEQLHGSTGVAIALITPASTIARFAVALGAEGLGVALVFGPTF